MASRVRTENACLRASFAEQEATPTFTLDQQVKLARREMGEEKWRKLNSEWSKS